MVLVEAVEVAREVNEGIFVVDPIKAGKWRYRNPITILHLRMQNSTKKI